MRYVKDAPLVGPVSYPMRVAPLPEDKSVEGEGEGEGRDEVEKEGRRIREEEVLKRRVVRAAEQEKVRVPFPSLIKVKQKEKPPVFDLSEAIRQVKVSVYGLFFINSEVFVYC